MSDDVLGFDRALTRSERAATILLGAGAGVASLSAVYVARLSPWMADMIGPFGFTLVLMFVVGVIPLVVGLTLAIRGGARLRGLRRLRTRPTDVVSADLAMHGGRPALRLGFATPRGGHVVVATGDVDREPIIEAVRAGTLGARLPSARVVKR